MTLRRAGGSRRSAGPPRREAGGGRRGRRPGAPGAPGRASAPATARSSRVRAESRGTGRVSPADRGPFPLRAGPAGATGHAPDLVAGQPADPHRVQAARGDRPARPSCAPLPGYPRLPGGHPWRLAPLQARSLRLAARAWSESGMICMTSMRVPSCRDPHLPVAVPAELRLGVDRHARRRTRGSWPGCRRPAGRRGRTPALAAGPGRLGAPGSTPGTSGRRLWVDQRPRCRRAGSAGRPRAGQLCAEGER